MQLLVLLTHSKKVQGGVGSIGDSKLPVDVNGYLCLYLGPATDCHPVQDVPLEYTLNWKSRKKLDDCILFLCYLY